MFKQAPGDSKQARRARQTWKGIPMAQKAKTESENKRRDKTRDKTSVKAKRQEARKSKAKRREFERGDWT
jgi:hypothetical protein